MNAVERAVRRVDAFQQRHPPLAFAFAVVKKSGDDRSGALAALMTYYGFLSLFPLLLLLATILGYVLDASPTATSDVLHSALVEFPIIGDQLTRSIQPLRGSGLALAIGLLGLVWGALGISQAVQHAMAEVWNVPGVIRPGFFPRLARSLVLLALFGASVIVATGTAWLASRAGAHGLSRALGILGSLVTNCVLSVIAFRVTTPKSVPTGDLVRGAVAAAVAWTALQTGGGFLVTHQLRHTSAVYGFFATVLGALWWLYLTAQVTLYGAEINVVRTRRLWPRSIVQPPLTPADRRTLADIAKQEERRPEETVDVTFSG